MDCDPRGGVRFCARARFFRRPAGARPTRPHRVGAGQSRHAVVPSLPLPRPPSALGLSLSLLLAPRPPRPRTARRRCCSSRACRRATRPPTHPAPWRAARSSSSIRPTRPSRAARSRRWMPPRPMPSTRTPALAAVRERRGGGRAGRRGAVARGAGRGRAPREGPRRLWRDGRRGARRLHQAPAGQPPGPGAPGCSTAWRWPSCARSTSRASC